MFLTNHKLAVCFNTCPLFLSLLFLLRSLYNINRGLNRVWMTNSRIMPSFMVSKTGSETSISSDWDNVQWITLINVVTLYPADFPNRYHPEFDQLKLKYFFTKKSISPCTLGLIFAANVGWIKEHRMGSKAGPNITIKVTFKHLYYAIPIPNNIGKMILLVQLVLCMYTYLLKIVIKVETVITMLFENKEPF